MSELLLSEQEIKQITGLVQPAAQERFLREKFGVQASRNAANRVIVFRSQIDPNHNQPAAAPLPDFAAMDDVA